MDGSVMNLSKKEKIASGFMAIVPFVLAFVLMIIVAIMAGAVLAIKYSGEWLQNNLIYVVSLYHVALVSFFGTWYIIHCRKYREARLKDIIGIKTIVSVLLLGIGGQLLSRSFIFMVYRIAPSLIEQYGDLMSKSGLGELTPPAFVAAVILAPIGEEIIFRGLTIHYLERTGAWFWLVNSIQALLFGILHGNIIQGCYAFALGLVLGFVAHKYQSIIPGILVHLCYNLLGSFDIFDFGENDTAYIIVAIIGALLVGIALFILFKEKKRTRATGERVDNFTYYAAYTHKAYRVVIHVVIPLIIYPLGALSMSTGEDLRNPMAIALISFIVLIESIGDFVAFGGSFSRKSPINWMKSSSRGKMIMNGIYRQDIIIKLVRYFLGWVIIGATPLLNGEWEIVACGLLINIAVIFVAFIVVRLISIPQYTLIATVPAMMVSGLLMACFEWTQGKAGLEVAFLLVMIVLAIVAVAALYKVAIGFYDKSFNDEGVVE